MTDTSAARPRRRNMETRARILAAALEVVVERGYAGTTIEGIAARAGVGKQTIYRWWRNLGEVVLDAVADLRGDGESGIVVPDTGDIAADLRTVLRATAQEFSDPAFDGPLRVLTARIAVDEDLRRAYATRLEAPVEEAYRTRLDRAAEVGQIDSCVDRDALREMLLGPFFRRWLLCTGPLDEVFVDDLVEGALRAAGGPAGAR